jgi:endonuclease/exonuclease/phosphatase family metal-dependent hydrolase
MGREIKIATFNVEWMVNLFKNGKPELATKQNKRAPGLGAKPKDPQGVADRIAAVIKDLKADIIGICEGPPLKTQMQHFVKEKLGNDYVVYSMEDGSQSVHALVHKRLARGVTITQLPRADKVYERMEKVRALYKWGNPRKELKVRFTRLPVILRMKRKGKTTEVMVVHTKSKISELQKAKQWEKKNKAAVISAIFSRQKLSQEMNVIRKYIAHRLYTKNAEAVIVMGDMNDGITRDLIDEHYLLHSIVHELRGAFHHEVALMRHVLTGKQLQKKRDAWTVEFRDATNKGRTRRVLLDHILFSPACYDGGRFCFVKNSGTIEHKVFDKYIVRRGATRDERPSDHKPLSARFALI